MRFIGELYKGYIISIKIILFCLPALLEGDTAGAEFALKLFIDDEDSDSDSEEEDPDSALRPGLGILPRSRILLCQGRVVRTRRQRWRGEVEGEERREGRWGRVRGIRIRSRRRRLEDPVLRRNLRAPVQDRQGSAPPGRQRG